MIILAPYKVNFYFKNLKREFRNIRLWVIPQVGHKVTFEHEKEFFTGTVESCSMEISNKRQDINIIIS